MYGTKRAFLVGALLGGLTALALAPKTGREFRKDIEGGAENLKYKTHDLANEVRDRGKFIARDIVDKSSELIRKDRDLM